MSIENTWKEIEKRLTGVKILAEDGATNSMIANYLGLSLFQLRKYASLYPELKEAMNVSRNVAIKKLENTMYRKALGVYEVNKKTTITQEIVDEVEDDETGQMVEVVRTRTKTTRVNESGMDSSKADINAIKFLLENYAPDEFKRTPSESAGIEEVAFIDDVPEKADNVILYDDSQDIGGSENDT